VSDELPKGWMWTDFDSVLCSITNGLNGKQNKDSIGLPVSRIETISNQYVDLNKIGFIEKYETQKVEKYRLNPGDILFSHINSPIHLGKTAIVPDDIELFHGVNLLRMTLNEAMNERIFNYYCKYIRAKGEFSEKAQHAVNQSSLNQKNLKSFRVLAPPLNEQIRIANKLDSLLAKVDVTQTRLEKIPTLLKRFRQSVLATATSGELMQEWRKNATFGEAVNVGSLTSDIRYGTSKKCTYEEGGMGVLRIPNIGDRGIDARDLKFADFDINEKEKLGLKEGDLLIIRSNGSVELVGKAAIVTDKDVDYLFAGYLIRLRFKNLSEIDPKYVLFSLQSPAIRHVIEINARSTSGINNINSKELAALEINLPSYKEQKEIVRRVESLFSLADSIEKQYTEAKKHTDRLTQSLLAKAFRGELVPQDPNDEPASELLKRIQAERKQQAANKSKRKTVTKRKINKKVIMKLNDAPESYLVDLLTQLGGEADARILWNKTDLAIDDFYAKLKQEMQTGLIVDDKASSDPSQRKLKLAELDSI